MAVAEGAAMKLAITGIGMVSPLGLDAPTSCASARAGLVRAAPLDSFKIYNRGAWAHVGVVGHALREYAGGFAGLGRIVRLGSGALADLLRTFPLTPDDLRATALCAVLPSGYFQIERAREPESNVDDRSAPEALKESLTQHCLDRICNLCSIVIPSANRSLIFEDQAGFAGALKYAWQALSSGRFERCIVGGLDACTDADFLAAANHFKALKTEERPAGFQPGEAAAFLLVETAAMAFKRGSRVLAWVEAAAAGREQVSRCSRKPALGIGLTETIAACLNFLPEPNGVGWTLADLNGDVFRANDWGYAATRLAARGRRIGALPITMPAESFGEIGSAQGAVASCMAVRAFVRSYAPAPRVLVWLSSYDGGRGAFVIASDGDRS
jgi:3-oxoacyl-[acyl-carrier-protein] synthase I